MRTLVAAAALALLTAPPLWAQVAVTDLVPAAPRYIAPEAPGLNSATLTPDNPAALQWGQPSRLAAGALQGKHTDEFTGEETNYDGAFGGFRLVGSWAALAAEQLDAQGDDPTLDFEETVSSAQLSLGLGDVLALGGGVERSEFRDFDLNSAQAGVSLHLGEYLYLGYVRTQDEVEFDFFDQTFDRETQRYGVGIRVIGDWSWYAEYYEFDMEPFDLPAFFGPFDFELDTRNASVQVNLGGLMVGYTYTEVDVPAEDEEAEIQIADLAWAPESGWSLGGRYIDTEVKNPLGEVFERNRTTSVALTYLF